MKIYVATHKLPDKKIKDDLYEPLLVGSYNKEYSNIQRDDVGDNISHKNENYCELTGIYWMWKNSSEDILGLCHYRRFLSKNRFSGNTKYYLNCEDIRQAFSKENIDIILPRKIYFNTQIISNKSTAPNSGDMEIVRMIMLEKCPEYLEDFDTFISGYSAYLCNIMIAKKEIFDEYCTWLFGILYEAEIRIAKHTYIDDPYRKRLFGFISERLFNVWMIHNAERFRVREYFLVNTANSLFERFRYEGTQFVRKIKHMYNKNGVKK